MTGPKYKFAFIMDPMHTVLVDKDTTFVMMLEAQTRGHQNYVVDLKDMFCRGPQPAMPGLSMRRQTRNRPLHFSRRRCGNALGRL